MADTDFHEKYRAHQAHAAAVPGALTSLRNALIDFNGQPLGDGEAPLEGLRCGELRTVLAEVDRLQAQVQQLRKDMAEEQREFQREARDIAAEARYQEREERGDY